MDSILSGYQKLLDTIREYQPDAEIIIQAVTTFGRNKAKQYTYMVPSLITSINEELKMLAEKNDGFFIDFNPEVVDEEGYLPYEWSNDGCHPTAAGYMQWSQWIIDNAGSLGIG